MATTENFFPPKIAKNADTYFLVSPMTQAFAGVPPPLLKDRWVAVHEEL